MTASVRTRFAPSPTGYLHIGGVRTALFSWLYARHHQGSFVLRIEDTDRERSTDESVQVILDGMKWLGLECDEGPFYQTQRYDRYKEIIQRLRDDDKAYYCYCSKEALDVMREEAMARGDKPRYDGRCRHTDQAHKDDIQPVVRFKNPQEGEVVIEDLIQGTVVYKNSELDDLIIARSDGTPTYNLTVVVDDMDMRITDVIRGDDHLNNTPRQINIFHALGAEIPNYAHMPLILGEDGSRLSKRHGAANILQYKEDGYLPEALLNYLVRLGWSHGDQEIFSMAEMIEYFDIKDVNKSAASVNLEKLLWLNQHYIKTGDNTELAEKLGKYFEKLDIDLDDGPDIQELIEIQKDRAKTLLEMAEQSRCFYVDFDAHDADAAKKHLRPVILEPLEKLREKLASLEQWQDENLHQIIVDTATEFDIKMGKIAQPLRVAITGGSVSPSIDVTLRLIGKKRVLSRLDLALDYVRRRLTESGG
jgi:glutamyl-tRNA synthetase